MGAVRESAGWNELTITEVNLPSEEARATSAKSWRMVMQNLKELLED
jgi:hypothetical protein